MTELDEEKQTIFKLLALAQDLQKTCAIPSVDLDFIVTQYNAIWNRLTLIDGEAPSVLPFLSRSDLTQAKAQHAVNQLVSYLSALVYVKLAIIKPEDPWARLLPMLTECKLSLNWAIAASALCLIEVMVNRKLSELDEDTSGEFDKRIARLNSSLEKKTGARIPEVLLSGLYKSRSKVIHEGKEPTSEEISQIFEILNSFYQKLKLAK